MLPEHEITNGRRLDADVAMNEKTNEMQTAHPKMNLKQGMPRG